MLGYDAGASGSLVGEYDGSGNLIQETVWLGDIPVATIRPNGSSVAIHYVVTDQVDTPREVIRPSDNTQMWSWFTAPFGAEAPNTNPQGAGTFTYDLRFPGQIAGAWGSTYQNDHRDYDPSAGRYDESDPIGLKGGGFSTYSYAGSNPISNFDPSGLTCASTNHFTYCTYPDGGPSFRIAEQSGYPDALGPDDFLDFLRYHKYDASVPLGNADPNCVMQKLIDKPTPGSPNPATPDGTRNNAQVFSRDNWVTSYLTTDLNTGNPLVVNVTDANSYFSPGYVARTVSDGAVHTYGEGLAWSQSIPGPRDVGNWYYWERQMQQIVKECSCNK